MTDLQILSALVPQFAQLVVDEVRRTAAGIVIVARACRSAVACPTCGLVSTRVHGRYRRRVRDLPLGGLSVEVLLTVRRFLCAGPQCPAVTFAEQVPGLTIAHGRHSAGLRDKLTAIGLALAGRAGSRLARVLGLLVGRTTMLRLLRALPDPGPFAAPSVLGIDDFAIRRGHVYGTVLVDMATRRPIDLLPERTADPVAAWLRAHPGVTVLCRDRAGAYAEAARTAAPDATQVADRWHLWNNLCEAAEKSVRRHHRCLGDAQVAGPIIPDPGAAVAATPEAGLHTRTRHRHGEIHALHGQGRTQSEIQRILGYDYKTVRRYLRAERPEDLFADAQRGTKLAAYTDHLEARWNAGVTDAEVLTREIAEHGYRGSSRTVRRYLQSARDGITPLRVSAKPPKARDLTGWITRHPATLTEDEQRQLTDALAACPDLSALARLVRDFAEMMNNQDGHLLDEWIAAAHAGDSPELHTFANGLQHDHTAVTNGLTLPYSSGAVEGNVNRIKMLKRQMYGRANFDLLRLRVILAH